MQPTPLRLSQVIRLAFNSSRPVQRSSQPLKTPNLRPPLICLPPWLPKRSPGRLAVRGFSDQKSKIDKKVEDAKKRVDETTSSYAAKVASTEKLRDSKVESTIIHTNLESSSIEHPRRTPDIQESPSPSSPSANSSQDDSELPSHISSRRSAASKRFSHFMDNLQSNIFTASRRLNDLTGYSGIEALKSEIESQESHAQEARRAVKDARVEYATAVTTRSATQREVNDLLQRKTTWNPTDLQRFTDLYTADHSNEAAEAAAQVALSAAESRYEEASTKLARTILARYHEEQIWSDKIRQMSTWGTWGLMGLNVLLFILFQVLVEPWRRQRLVRGFEEKVKQALEDQKAELLAGSAKSETLQTVGEDVSTDRLAALVDSVTGTTVVETPPLTAHSAADLEAAKEAVETVEAVTSEPAEFSPAFGSPTAVFAKPAATLSGYAYYQDAFQELFSDRKLVVTQKELTTVALEGAVGGGVIVGLLLVLLRPR